MGLFSSIDFGAFAAGAADQYVENVEKKNDYYRDLMTKQEDYMMRYGRKIVNDRTSMANSAVEMLDALEAGGLDPKSAEELVSNYGYQGVSALKKLQEQFETQYDGATLDLNAVFKGSEDYVRQEGYDIDQALKDQFLVEVAKADTSAGDAASDAEDRGFFASLGDMFVDGGGAKARYEASRIAPSVAGYSYNDILAMEGMGMPASRGLPTFDRSALADPAAGKLNDASQNRLAIRLTDSIVDSSTMTDREWRDALGINDPKDITVGQKLNWIINNRPEEASGLLRKFNIDGELANNTILSVMLGGPDILADLLKEPEEETIIEPVVPSSEALAELAENNIDPATVLTYDTEAKAAEAFKNDTTIQFALVNGELLSNETYEAPSIIEDTTTSKTNLPAKPPIVTETSGKTSPLTDQSIQTPTKESDSDRAEWEEKYGGKLNDDGSYILANPRPLEAVLKKRYGSNPTTVRRMLEGWDRKYGNTHDPITGYPLLGDELKLELIPGTDEYEEANK